MQELRSDKQINESHYVVVLSDAATFVPLSQVPPDLSPTVPPDISATFNKVDICPTYN